MALPTSEKDMRALEPKCAQRDSADSVRTTTHLAALHVGTQRKFLYRFEEYDLYNLTRCVLDAELSPDTKLEDGMPVFMQAAARGNAKTLKALLEGKANHALTFTKGMTAIHGAAANGRLDCLQLLLEFGADANVVMADGSTPLMVALLQKQVECVKALVPASDLEGVRDCHGYASLHVSVLYASAECVSVLLKHVKDVDLRTGVGPASTKPVPELWTALHLAAEFNRPAMAQALLDAGASRMARDAHQNTPLHRAAKVGSTSCAKVLLKGASSDFVEATTVQDFTALHVAAYSGHSEFCSLLLASGARPDQASRDGITPLRLAQKAHPANAKLLALLAIPSPAAGASIPPPPPPPKVKKEAAQPAAPPPPTPPQPARAAALKGVTAVTQPPGTPLPPLPAMGAELRALDAKCADDASAESRMAARQMRALSDVIKKLKMERFVELDAGNLLRILLAAGAPADAVLSMKGRPAPAAFHAALLGHARALRALLAGGAKHTCVDERGLTLLRAAVESGSVACIRLLVEAGADVNSADFLGNTPLLVAIMAGTRGVAVARELLPHSDLSVTNQQGHNAFHLCVGVGNLDVFQALLLLMEDVDVRTRREGSVFGRKVEVGWPDRSSYCLRKGAACHGGRAAGARRLSDGER